MTQLVKIVSMDPFVVDPNNLGSLSFQQVGILDTETFKQVLVQKFLPTGLPPQTIAAMQQMPLNPSVQIELVINAVEGILLS
jgi:hypothetical protein